MLVWSEDCAALTGLKNGCAPELLLMRSVGLKSGNIASSLSTSIEWNLRVSLTASHGVVPAGYVLGDVAFARFIPYASPSAVRVIDISWSNLGSGLITSPP